MSKKNTVNFWSIAGINLLAWPGLGTFLAGRKLSGFIQAVMSLVGATLTICLFLVLFKFAYYEIGSEKPLDSNLFFEQNSSLIFYGIIGLGIFAFAWFWSAISTYLISIELCKNLKK